MEGGIGNLNANQFHKLNKTVQLSGKITHKNQIREKFKRITHNFLLLLERLILSVHIPNEPWWRGEHFHKKFMHYNCVAALVIFRQRDWGQQLSAKSN